MTPTATRLAALQSRNWICKHPEKAHAIQGMQVLHIQGQITGQERDAWMCVFSGKAMLWRGEDYEFEGFLELLDGKAEAVKPLAGQRELFGDCLS